MAGVETKSIVERGLWDDLFPLEGGGHVQMKLQFVLNEDERNRIRMMVLFLFPHLNCSPKLAFLVFLCEVFLDFFI